MTFELIEPEGWERPRGYSNGVLIPPGARLCFVAGQVAWDADQSIVGVDDFPRQFRQALVNVVAVVEAAGGSPTHLCDMTIFVADKEQYSAATKELGAIWRDVVGKHYPAMALVQVAALLEEHALVEIQAIAAIPA